MHAQRINTIAEKFKYRDTVEKEEKNKAKNDSIQENLDRAQQIIDNRISSVKQKDSFKIKTLEQQNKINKD